MNAPESPYVQAVKEVLRLLVFALPGILLNVLQTRPGLVSGAVGLAVLTLLKAADKYVHTSNSPANGLLPF
jgi:hypothetical protein